MKGLKTAALVVVALVIVSVGLAYIAGMQVQRTLLNPEFCGNLVDQINLGSAVQDMLREQMREEITGGGEDAEQLDIIFDSMAGAFPPEWIEQQAKMALHNFIPSSPVKATPLLLSSIYRIARITWRRSSSATWRKCPLNSWRIALFLPALSSGTSPCLFRRWNCRRNFTWPI